MLNVRDTADGIGWSSVVHIGWCLDDVVVLVCGVALELSGAEWRCSSVVQSGAGWYRVVCGGMQWAGFCHIVLGGGVVYGGAEGYEVV